MTIAETALTSDEAAEASPGVERGSFATTDSGPRSKLVVATYNIRYGVGSFLISGSLLRRVGLTLPNRRHSLVGRHLQRAAAAFTAGRLLPPADILALQEADKETIRAGRHDVAVELARALRMHYASAMGGLPRAAEPEAKQWYLDFEERIAHHDAGDTGIALLSRLPLTKVERLELPWSESPSRPHLALAATVRNGSQALHLFNAHIDPHASINGQLDQHQAILERAQTLRGPVVLLGDFNTLSKSSQTAMRRLLESHGFETPFENGTATWRAGLIRLHTDWIFVRGVRVTRCGVARPLGVSDHWPIWAELDMERAAPSTA